MNKTQILTVAFALFSFCANGQTIFVKHDATGANDGSSWTDAYTDLETAIGVATETIWVAAGTYTPTTERGGENDDRFKAFQMKNGVAIHGGFAGTEDPNDFDLNDRDFNVNETILSGDLGGDVNVYHVFRHVDIGLDDTAVLDGFTISGGKADGSEDVDKRGGGMLNDVTGSSTAGSSPTIRNCIFKNNEAVEGGAIYNSRYSSPVITNTVFDSNTATDIGGAVYMFRNNSAFNGCTFLNNTADGTGSDKGGGAVYVRTVDGTEGVSFTDCLFSGNTVNKTSSGARGGAIHASIDPGFLSIAASTFRKNEAEYGGAVYVRAGSDPAADDSSIAIASSTFEDNSASSGGAIFNERHNISVTTCIIRGNLADVSGGGYYSRFGSSELVNSLFSGNRSDDQGGGIYFHNETATLLNTTVSGNYANNFGGGIRIIGLSDVSIKNTILWGNVSNDDGNQLSLCSGCEVDIDHSLYGNDTGDILITETGTLTATNSLSDDPLFFNPLAPDEINTPNTSGIYMIQGTSPAVDAGNNDHIDDYNVTHDLRGGPRIVDGNENGTATIDIGAYEYNPTCSSNPPISGKGTDIDPYVIAEPGNFCWMAQNPAEWNKHYRQETDIDLTGSAELDGGQGLRPIGNSITKFTGTYDGQGFSISNLVINRPNETNVGLFGIIDGQSGQRVVVQNINLVNANITGGRNVGALVGMADQWNEVTNCHVSGTVQGNRDAGGLVGWGRRTDFLRCSSSADVSITNPALSGAIYHGGLTGHINQSSTVRQSFATGNVSGRARVGGLIGAVGWNSRVENSYARGNVESDTHDPMMGGLIGEVWNAGVRKSYSTGHVNMDGVTSEYGGLVGNITTDTNFFDENSFWDTETSGQADSEMGTGKTTAEMTAVGTFTNTATEGLDDPWDFSVIWAIDADVNDGYPYLQFNLFTWTGGESTNWGNVNNWDQPQIPATGNSVLIPGSLINYPVVDGARSIGDLTISEGASLTIPAKKSLTINGTLSNNAGNDGLLIQSDASGTGSLIHNTDDVAGTVENYVAGGGTSWNKNATAWYYIAAPVVDQNIAAAMEAAFPGGQNHNDFDLYRWSEADDLWINYHSTVSPTFDRTDFLFGEGYIFGAPASVTLSLSGKLGSGDAEWKNLTHSGEGDPEVYAAGWHLLGNPFPSGIVDDGWTKTNFVATPKIWKTDDGSYEDVSEGFIPLNTAFFMQVDGTVSHVNNTLTIPFSARVHRAPDPDKNTPQNRILLVAQAAGSEMRQQHVIRLEPDATDGFDPRYDSRFMAGYAPQLFSITETDRLSTLAIPEITDDLVIPMAFHKNDEGEDFLIQLKRNIDEAELYLHDLKTDNWHELDFDKPYAFTADPDDLPIRFELHFSPPEDDDDVNVQEMDNQSTARLWYHDNRLYVQTDEPGTRLTIYDLNGRTMQTYQPESGLQSYHIKLPPGAYIARLNGKNNMETQKIIIP